MKNLTAAVLATALTTGFAFADPVDDTLVLNDDTAMVTRTAAPAHMADAVDEVMSGWLFRGTETRMVPKANLVLPVTTTWTAWRASSRPIQSGMRLLAPFKPCKCR
jgi:hypothetical protein